MRRRFTRSWCKDEYESGSSERQNRLVPLHDVAAELDPSAAQPLLFVVFVPLPPVSEMRLPRPRPPVFQGHDDDLRDGHREQDGRGEQYEFQHVRHRLGIDRVGTLAEGYCSRWKGTTPQVELVRKRVWSSGALGRLPAGRKLGHQDDRVALGSAERLEHRLPTVRFGGPDLRQARWSHPTRLEARF